MPMCFSSARMASLALSPYFSSIASSLGEEVDCQSECLRKKVLVRRSQCDLTLDLEYLSWKLAFR